MLSNPLESVLAFALAVFFVMLLRKLVELFGMAKSKAEIRIGREAMQVIEDIVRAAVLEMKARGLLKNLENTLLDSIEHLVLHAQLIIDEIGLTKYISATRLTSTVCMYLEQFTGYDIPNELVASSVPLNPPAVETSLTTLKELVGVMVKEHLQSGAAIQKE